MKKLYLDIDGVLLSSWHPQVAPGAVQLIDYVTQHFDCYWLTSYCKGDARYAMRLLSEYFDEATMEKLAGVKATNWRGQKTDAIDFESDFYWLDDNPTFTAEHELKLYDRLDRLIVVDLRRENELKRIVELLK
jgi:hypothetical protein